MPWFCAHRISAPTIVSGSGFSAHIARRNRASGHTRVIHCAIRMFAYLCPVPCHVRWKPIGLIDALPNYDCEYSKVTLFTEVPKAVCSTQ